MKISTKELRQLIRETIEETIKEAPISGLGMGSTPRGGGFAGAKPPSNSGEATEMTSDDPNDKLVDARLLSQISTSLKQAKSGDPKGAANFMSMTKDSRDPRVRAMRTEYDKWNAGKVQEAKLRKMIGDIIKEQKATPKKRK